MASSHCSLLHKRICKYCAAARRLVQHIFWHSLSKVLFCLASLHWLCRDRWDCNAWMYCDDEHGCTTEDGSWIPRWVGRASSSSSVCFCASTEPHGSCHLAFHDEAQISPQRPCSHAHHRCHAWVPAACFGHAGGVVVKQWLSSLMQMGAVCRYGCQLKQEPLRPWGVPSEGDIFMKPSSFASGYVKRMPP